MVLRNSDLSFYLFLFEKIKYIFFVCLQCLLVSIDQLTIVLRCIELNARKTCISFLEQFLYPFVLRVVQLFDELFCLLSLSSALLSEPQRFLVELREDLQRLFALRRVLVLLGRVIVRVVELDLLLWSEILQLARTLFRQCNHFGWEV